MILDKIFVFFKKNFSRKDWLFIFLLISLYFLTRLINIEKFPIFNDEGIYIQWAKTAWRDASWRFISLTDGKQPLQTWATIPLLKMFPTNALLAGRLFGVASGFFSLIGLFCLLFILFNKRTAYIGSLLYIFTPYFLFYDRLAIMDSAVNTAFIWILFFSIALSKKIRFDVALLFGLVAGLSLLTKSSVQVFIVLAALGPVLFLFNNDSHQKKIKYVVNFFFLYLIVVGLAFVIYNIQRLSPFLHFVSEKNKVFLLSFSEFVNSPFQVFFQNLKTLPVYVFWEMGFVLAITGIIGWFFLWKKGKNLFIYFSLWTLLLYIGVCLFTRILYPRYLIFFASLMTISTSYLFSYFKNKINVLLSVLLLLSFLLFDYFIFFDIKNVPFPPVDRGQYLEGWTAGWGMREIMDFAKTKSKEKPVVILAEGDFGMSGDVLNVFLNKDDRIFIKGYWPLTGKEIIDNYQELKKSFVYIVISHQDILPQYLNNLNLIKKFDKPGKKSAIYLFELK
jgi:4-amino-4-deoxy-L-arabinose transferase-like glycosyltransferase